MRNIIESLREKSETYRRLVALSTSLVVTLVIAGIWATATFPSVGGAVAKRGAETTSRATAAVQEPATSFGQNVALTFSAVKGQWQSVTDYFSRTTYESDNELQDLEAYSPKEYKK